MDSALILGIIATGGACGWGRNGGNIEAVMAPSYLSPGNTNMHRNLLPAFLLFTVPALASTPDGMTPAEETVCDIYEGDAFGLCNAYCEAMDCDYETPNASAQACGAVARNFLRATGEELVCDSGIGECAFEAVDDYVEAYHVDSATFSVFDNDLPEPADCALEVISHTGDANVSLDDAATGTFTVTKNDSNEWPGTFEYEACCDECCDTAVVGVSGS